MPEVALVTGASRGIGRAILEGLRRDGLTAYGCSRRPPDGHPDDRGWYQCDVSTPGDVGRVVDAVLQREGRIDVLVNNAGISYLAEGRRIPFTSISAAQWDEVLRVNLSSAFWFCQHVGPAMIRQRGGSIVNIVSASVRMGGVLAAVDYISSKAGLVGLTKGLAFELGEYNIRVNAVAPGRIRTDMTRDAVVAGDWAERNVLLKRFGTGDDVAGVVSFLASKRADYITGCVIDCNGGWVVE